MRMKVQDRPQKPGIGPYSEAHELNPHHPTIFLFRFNIILPSTCRFSKGSLPFTLSEQNLLYCMPPSHIILLQLLP